MAKNSSGHHHTTLSGYIFATKAHIDNWKKLVNSNILCSGLLDLTTDAEYVANLVNVSIWL